MMAKFIKVAAYDQCRPHSLRDRSPTCITAANPLHGFHERRWNSAAFNDLMMMMMTIVASAALTV